METTPVEVRCRGSYKGLGATKDATPNFWWRSGQFLEGGNIMKKEAELAM